jgi:hypothetical protein
VQSTRRFDRRDWLETKPVPDGAVGSERTAFRDAHRAPKLPLAVQDLHREQFAHNSRLSADRHPLVVLQRLNDHVAHDS